MTDVTITESEERSLAGIESALARSRSCPTHGRFRARTRSCLRAVISWSTCDLSASIPE